MDWWEECVEWPFFSSDCRCILVMWVTSSVLWERRLQGLPLFALCSTRGTLWAQTAREFPSHMAKWGEFCICHRVSTPGHQNFFKRGFTLWDMSHDAEWRQTRRIVWTGDFGRHTCMMTYLTSYMYDDVSDVMHVWWRIWRHTCMMAYQ